MERRREACEGEVLSGLQFLSMGKRNPIEDAEGKGSSQPDLWAVIAPVCASASVGTLASILVAVRQIHPVVRLEFDMLSVSAGLVTAGVGWALGRGLWRLGRAQPEGVLPSDQRRLQRRVVLGLGTLGLLIVVGFVVASMGIPESRRRDMVAGGILAILVLSVVGGVLMGLARLFGRPDDPEGGQG